MEFVNVHDMKRFSPERYQKVNLFATPLSVMDVYCLQPGQAQKVHAHAGNDKYYVVLEGTATIRIGAEEREVGPGWAALARQGVEHGIRNGGSEPLTVLVFQAPTPF